MKILIALSLFVSASAFAGNHGKPASAPKCAGSFEIVNPAGFDGYCCATKAHFVVAPTLTCSPSYTLQNTPKPEGSNYTYYYCCDKNGHNGGGNKPKTRTN